MKSLTEAVFSLLLGGVLGTSAQAQSQVIECQGVHRSGAQVEFKIVHETGFYFLNSEPLDNLACAKDEEDSDIHICHSLMGSDDELIVSLVYILDEANGRLTSVSVASFKGETTAADTWTLDGLSCG